MYASNLQADVTGKKIAIDYYGHQLEFDLNKSAITKHFVLLNDSSIKSTVNYLQNHAEVDSLYRQLQTIAVDYKLDNMAYWLLIKQVTEEAFKKEQEAFKQLFMFTLLWKMDLDLILGFNSQVLTIYARTNVWLDNIMYVQDGNKYYFDISFNQKRIPGEESAVVFDKPNNQYPFVINTMHPPALNASYKKQIIPFEYDGFVYFFPVTINYSLVSYYRDLPTIDISSMYLNYGLSDVSKQSLVKEIKKAVKGMNTEIAIDFILKFTQRSFEYRRDEEIYGQEKFSFPEETLLNNYSDCEDKAMLFATLVKEVIGLNSIALFYKDAAHINVAVQSPYPQMRHNFSFNDKNYIVCEPTLEGFAIGQNAVQTKTASLIEW